MVTTPYLYLCMLGVCLLHLCNILGDLAAGMQPDYEQICFYLDGGFSIGDWVFCVIGGGLGFCGELRHGYVQYNIVRINKNIYCASKVITAGLGGFFCSFLGLELFHGCYLLFLAISQGSFHQLIPPHMMNAVGENQGLIFGMSLMCAVLSMLGLLTALLVNDTFVSMAMPILFFYIYANVGMTLLFPTYLLPAQVFYYSEGVLGKVYAFFVVVCVGIGCYYFMNWRIARRLEHG